MVKVIVPLLREIDLELSSLLVLVVAMLRQEIVDMSTPANGCSSTD